MITSHGPYQFLFSQQDLYDKYLTKAWDGGAIILIVTFFLNQTFHNNTARISSFCMV